MSGIIYFVGLLFMSGGIGAQFGSAAGCIVFGTGLIVAAFLIYLTPTRRW